MFLKPKANELLWKVNIAKRKFLKRSHRKEIENTENILQILWNVKFTVNVNITVKEIEILRSLRTRAVYIYFFLWEAKNGRLLVWIYDR